MTQRARPAFLRRLLTACRLAPAIALLAALNLVSPAIAAEDGISLELNSAKTVSEACETSFVVRNGLPHTLDRFQLDLYVFDTDGVIKSRSTIDLAPLRANKSTVLAFRLHAAPCASVSKVLVNDIPLCRAESGTVLDCLAGLSVSSRHSIELAK
ncbi:MAG: Tat pathway signal protein [Rhodospirillaceae bacterium]|nr:Tat pathway signal protein [Rhodospirillaceae bacterium]MDD9915516.1 Tat pathway signal protein [Rhodospirillaceae bacterium]MDD9926917.1 Tat pathway signal protein [Rhodospirillaceae bacterium]